MFKRQQQQLQLKPDENAFNKNGKIGSSNVNLRNALGDLGNKLRNDVSSTQFVSRLETLNFEIIIIVLLFKMSKKDGMLALANKKAVKLEDDIRLLKELKDKTTTTTESKPVKHEFILLPNLINKQQQHRGHMSIDNDVRPMETSKMDISEHHDTDIEIEEIEDDNEDEDQHMMSTHVVDIDENDTDNPQFLAEYVKDIYIYLNELEVCSRLS